MALRFASFICWAKGLARRFSSSSRSWARHLSLRADVRAVEARVDRVTLDREALRTDVQGLRSDPFAIEAAARAHGLVRPGEIVVRLED